MCGIAAFVFKRRYMLWFTAFLHFRHLQTIFCGFACKTERVWLSCANQRKERTIADICNHYHCTDRGWISSQNILPRFILRR